MPYMLALHESAAVAMADGYARATGRTSFVSLHIAAGLANGLSMVLNARRARTPIVVTAGQQDRRHLIEDPMLSGDLVAIAHGAFKDAVEVTGARGPTGADAARLPARERATGGAGVRLDPGRRARGGAVRRPAAAIGGAD